MVLWRGIISTISISYTGSKGVVRKALNIVCRDPRVLSISLPASCPPDIPAQIRQPVRKRHQPSKLVTRNQRLERQPWYLYYKTQNTKHKRATGIISPKKFISRFAKIASSQPFRLSRLLLVKITALSFSTWKLGYRSVNMRFLSFNLQLKSLSPLAPAHSNPFFSLSIPRHWTLGQLKNQGSNLHEAHCSPAELDGRKLAVRAAMSC